MAQISTLTRFLGNIAYKNVAINKCSVCLRSLSYLPKEYEGNPDPGPIFIKQKVQNLLKTLTRVDLSKVYAKQKSGVSRLEQPIYQFMTDEQLEAALREKKEQVDDMIQMPPVVSVRKPIDTTLAKDPALQGLDTSTFVFTDITFGVHDSERIILVRDTEGNLRCADWELRDCMNQTYFPRHHKHIKLPKMFQDNYFEDLLKRQEYIFILDRACLQFEPNDSFYQKVVTITYQHVNENNAFEILRSTRHFGGFVFFLAWHKNIDNLLLELIETQHLDEANKLIELFGDIHQIKCNSDSFTALDEYIKDFAHKKGPLELAVQAYKNAVKQREELDEGINKAHGISV